MQRLHSDTKTKEKKNDKKFNCILFNSVRLLEKKASERVRRTRENERDRDRQSERDSVGEERGHSPTTLLQSIVDSLKIEHK